MTIIDTVIGEWSGKLFAVFVIPMVFGLAYEVFARYLFNAPTIWSYDVTYMDIPGRLQYQHRRRVAPMSIAT